MDKMKFSKLSDYIPKDDINSSILIIFCGCLSQIIATGCIETHFPELKNLKKFQKKKGKGRFVRRFLSRLIRRKKKGTKKSTFEHSKTNSHFSLGQCSIIFFNTSNSRMHQTHQSYWMAYIFFAGCAYGMGKTPFTRMAIFSWKTSIFNWEGKIFPTSSRQN